MTSNVKLVPRLLRVGLVAVILVSFLPQAGLGGPSFLAAEITEGILDRGLTFIHSAAEIVGSALVSLVDMVVGVDVSELETPLGYLGILTASLILFGALKAAQKVIWFIVLLGWALIIVRIILKALNGGIAGQ